MLDFNEAELQREGGAGAIPEDSIVPFKMTLRAPKAGKEGSTHAMFSRSGKGNEYLDVEFEAMGTFAGRKIWQNFTLVGSETAAKISMRTLRAILESAHGIAPSDASPQATEGRKLSDWMDFEGMCFLAKVGCKVEQSQKDGNYYINNELKKIITPDDAEYAAGEFISDKPLPRIPEPGEAPPATTAKPAASTPASAPAWGAPKSGGNGAQAPAAVAKSGAGPVPSWATR